MLSAPFIEIDGHRLRAPALRALAERGYVHRWTNIPGLDRALQSGCVPVYAGFDAAADSLTLNQLVQVMILRVLQRCGHKPIVLTSGGSTRIADPSCSSDAIATNIAGLRRLLERFLVFGEGPSDAVMVDNAQWLDGLGYGDLLRVAGPHLSVNRMLGFEKLRSRLEQKQTISFLEFNFAILQALDFLELSRRFGCVLQIGNGAQWDNIVSGVELTQRLTRRKVFGLAASPVATASALRLNAQGPSPDACIHFWRDVGEQDLGRLLRLFTDLPLDEIERLETLERANTGIMRDILARETASLAAGGERRS